jgi:serine protease
LTTSASGTWSVAVKPSANRQFRLVFPEASPDGGSVSSVATVLVAPKITRKLSDTKVALGAKVKFTGKVSPAHRGKTVYLQRLKAGNWTSVKSTRTTSCSTFTIGLKASSRKDFAWRIFMPKDASHVAGHSAKIVLTVT